MSKTRDTGYLNNILQYTPTGVSFVSGSTTLLSVSSSGNLTTTGTITAQTLVVQTVTSSISFITGSTKFGSSSINTHQFTGSMYVTGGFYVSASAFQIISPSTTYGGAINLINTSNNKQWNITNVGSGTGARSGNFEINNNTIDILAIAQSGYVGIGLNTPTNLLCVSKDLTGEAIVSISNTSATGFGLAINAAATTRYVLALSDYANNALVRFLGSGDVYIGSTTVTVSNVSMYWEKPSGTLTQVFSYTSGTKTIQEYYRQNGTSIGSITYNGTNTLYNATSDYRLKKDLKDFNGLEKLSAIKVYDFLWKGTEIRDKGVLAHELAKVLPLAVSGEKDGEKMQGVDYSKIVPVLVKAIQELKAENDTLKEILQRNNIQ